MTRPAIRQGTAAAARRWRRAVSAARGATVHDPRSDLNKLADDAAFDAAVRSSLHLFSKPLAKARYLCDVQFVDLSQPATHVVGLTRYWFGLFSHKRATFQWKGMLEIPLGTLADDANAAKILARGVAS